MRFAALSGSRFSGSDSAIANAEAAARSALSAANARRPCSSVTCSAMASKPWLADLAEDVAEDRPEGLLATLRDRAFFAAAFFAFFANAIPPATSKEC